MRSTNEGARDLETLRRRLQRWRQRHGGPGRRIPEALWEEAATLAQREGVVEVARAVLAVAGIKGVFELLGGVVEVDELDARGQLGAEERPVVARPVGELDEPEVGALRERGVDLRGEHRLERHLLRLRHARKAQRLEALPGKGSPA